MLELSLDALQKDAEALLKQVRKSEPEALGRYYTHVVGGEPGLPSALHVIAREHGFDSWAKLKKHVENPE